MIQKKVRGAVFRSNLGLFLASLVFGGLMVVAQVVTLQRNGGQGVNAVGLLVMIALIGGSVVGMFLALWWFIRPETHPIMKRLARFKPDVSHTLQTVDADISMGKETLGRLIVSEDWLVHHSTFGFGAMRIRDVAWLYMHTNRQKSQQTAFGSVKVKLASYLYVGDTFGINLIGEGDENQVELILNIIAQRAPWAEVGFSQENNDMWQNNRAELIRVVQSRRAEMTGE